MQFEIFDQLLDAVTVLDHRKEIIYANSAFAQMLNISLKRLKTGKKMFEYIQFEDSSFIGMPKGDWGLHEATLYREFKFETAKGITGTASIAVYPLKEAKQYILFMRDMSLEIALQQKYRAELSQKEGVIEELQKAKVALEDYSKNLEQMVTDRTQALRDSHRFIKAMVDGIQQGLFVFDRQGVCGEQYTKACDLLFDSSPKGGQLVHKVLGISEKDVKSFQRWCESLFEDLLPFDDMKGLGPKEFINQRGQTIGLNYYPFYQDHEKNLTGIVVVATDHTNELQAKMEAQKNLNYANMVIKLVKNKNQFISFIGDARKMLCRLEDLAKLSREEIDVSEIFLLLHSIKGGAGVYSIDSIFNLAHQIETDFQKFKDESSQLLFEQWDFYLDSIHKLKTEFENYLEQNRPFLGEGVVDGIVRKEVPYTHLLNYSQKIKKIDSQLGAKFLKDFILINPKELLLSYSDLIIELAKNQQKVMNPIRFTGEKVKVRPDLFSDLMSTLVHAFTNAVIHGLESPEERTNSGKRPEGQIEVFTAEYTEDHTHYLFIKIEDDGRGIDPDRIRKKLIDNGTDPVKVDVESDDEIIQHIFDTNFSTATEVTQIAGRGVGMSAIKALVENMHGNLVVESIKGLGTKLQISIPLTFE